MRVVTSSCLLWLRRRFSEAASSLEMKWNNAWAFPRPLVLARITSKQSRLSHFKVVAQIQACCGVVLGM